MRLKVFNRDPIVAAIVQFNGCNGRSHGLPNVVLRVVKVSLPKCHETNQGPRGSSVGSLWPLKEKEKKERRRRRRRQPSVNTDDDGYRSEP